MRSHFVLTVFTGTEVDHFGRQAGLGINHDVIWLQISMHNSQLLVHILHRNQQLLHDDLDLSVLLEHWFGHFGSLPEELSQAHFHQLEDGVKFSVVVFDCVGLQNVRTVVLIELLSLVKLGHDLYFLTLHCLFSGVIFMLKFFDGVQFAGLDMSAPVNFSERTRAYQCFLFVFSTDHGFGASVGTLALRVDLWAVLLGHEFILKLIGPAGVKCVVHRL